MYIHRIAAISAIDESFFEDGKFHLSSENKLHAIEPAYSAIPHSALRRMGKAVRISVGTAMKIVQADDDLDGVIIGTANGGMEDSIKFMNQIVQYEEGMLTPGNFVQSTPNGLAAQIAMLLKNKKYNITHTHRGLSFENALIDANMLLRENPGHSYLLGAADEISTYNYNIDYLAGWYKRETQSNAGLYDSKTGGSIAGEGAVMLLLNQKPQGALARIKAVKTLHSTDADEVLQCFSSFLSSNFSREQFPDVMFTGENGDARFRKFYEACEDKMSPQTSILRYKHVTGEFPTASGLALFITLSLINKQSIPSTLLKKQGRSTKLQTFVLYNNYQGSQHSFILISVPEAS